jgi:hypothetical protein
MPRMSTEDAEFAARTIEVLFEDLEELRTHAESVDPGSDAGHRTHVGSARVTLLNLLDAATESDLKGTGLKELPVEGDGEAWEWLETAALAKALDSGMSSLVRDFATLRSSTTLGRELDVKKFRLAWDTLRKRLIDGPGVTITLKDGERGEVDIKVAFEPPMANPFNDDDAELTAAQVAAGNMMAYAFTRRNEEAG